MKTRPIKMFLIAITLPFLAGCSLVDNILGTIALNAVFESELLLNYFSVTAEDSEPKNFAVAPTAADKRASLTYGLDVLIIPKSASIEQMGFAINIDFEVTFSEGAQNLFYTEVKGMEEEEDSEFSASAQLFYPVGTVEKPTSIEDIGDWMNIDRLFELKKESAKDIKMTIKGTSGGKTKTRDFFFNLNSDAITLPGGGDVDVDVDFAFIIEEPSVETTFEVTVPKAELAAGYEIPLQIMWLNLEDQTPATGTLTVTVVDLNADVTITEHPATEISITKNETIVDWVDTVTLKTGRPVPANDLVITYKALITLS